jgi:hypothetical protein
MCLRPGVRITRAFDSISRFVLRKFPVEFVVSDFLDYEEYSQLRCHHADVYPRRWCDARNLVHYDARFFFLSPAIFELPEPFIVPGARAPPFDKEEDRLDIEPIVIDFRVSTVPRNLTVVDDFSYIYGVFHNTFMLWHTLFDFMIPLYHFVKFRGETDPRDVRETRRIYVRSDGVWSFNGIMRIFSLFPVTIISRSSLLIRRGTIGIEKLESDVDISRDYDKSIGFRYEFNRSTARGMREDVLERLNLSVDAVGKSGKPLVILVDRRGTGRTMQNTEALVAVMEKDCPHCLVETVKFEYMSVEQQIGLASKASAIVGFHGSGLAHVLWMAETREGHPTHLIELLPFRYICRDWYATAAAVAGVRYHGVMNVNETMGVTDQGLRNCWKKPQKCPTQQCHDLLRDQPTTIEVETFRETWAIVAKDLESTVVTEL